MFRSAPKMLSRLTLGVAVALGVTSTTALPTHASDTVLSVVARASVLEGRGAEVAVRLNGRDLGKFVVTSDTYEAYTIPTPAIAPGDKLDVRFTNDAASWAGDRNLWVKELRFGTTTLPSSTAQYDAGFGWGGATDGAQVSPGAELMAWSGALRFDVPQADVGLRMLAPAPLLAGAVQGLAAAPVFSPDSFWYQKIPTDAPVDPLSQAYVGNLMQDLRAFPTGLNTTAYAPPIYTVDATQPRVQVSHEACQGGSSDPAWIASQWADQFGAVPVPANAVGSAGADGEIVIHSPATGELWELWRFKKQANGYSACWGGKISNVAASNGVFKYPFSVSASGLSLLGGTVRIDELRSGRIDHAIAIGINRPRAGVYSWPANRTDGTWDDPTAIPEGTRFRLDPALDVDSLPLDPVGKMIARAGQQYGFIVRDNTFGPLVVYGENAAPYIAATGRNPYDSLSSAPSYSWLKNFPWDRLQAMPRDFGRA